MPPGVELMRHVEPFIGGGALFFNKGPERALLNDLNPELINVYTQVRDDVESLIGELEKMARKHDGQDSYYEARDRYNKKRLSERSRAAHFIYLNKTCFNGLHRVNRKGEFNVPAGRYKNPNICDEAGLRAASRALQKAELHCESFEFLVKSAKPGDFVYLDPPYAPMSETANFTAYAAEDFGIEAQIRLRDVYVELDRRGCKLMLSNSDVPVIRDLYGEFTIHTVAAPRAINCNAGRRGLVSEVVVCNY